MQDVKDSIGKVAVPGSIGLEVSGTILPWVSKSSSPTITKFGVASNSKDLWFTGKKALEELHYRPVFTLEEAVAQTAQWLREGYLTSNTPTN